MIARLSRLSLALVATLAAPSLAAPQADDVIRAVESKLRRDHLLSRTQHDYATTSGPFALISQKPRGGSSSHLQNVENLYAQWFDALGESFDAEILGPLELKQVRGEPFVPVFVFEDQRGFQNIARRGRKGFFDPDSVCVVDEVGVVVALIDSDRERPENDRRYPVLRQAFIEYLSTFYDGESLPAEKWYVFGLTGYLTAHGPNDSAAALEKPAPDPDDLELIASAATDGNRRPSQFLSVKDLLWVRSQKQIWTLYKRLAMDARAQSPGQGMAERLFTAQSSLFMCFLFRGEGGRYREGARQYFAKVLKDEGGEEALLKALDAPSLEELGAEFEAFLQHLVGGGELEDVMDLSASDPVVTPGLLYPVKSGDGLLGMALESARTGDYEGALAALQSALEAVDDDEWRPRIERASVRVAKAAEVRDAFFTSMTGTKRKLRFSKGDGKKVSGRIESIGDGVLKLWVKKDTYEELPLKNLPIDEVVAAIKKAGEPDPAWAVGYMRLLAGDDGWEEELEAGGDDADALKEDAGSIDELFRFGEAMGRLNALARRALPTESRDARKMFEAIAELAVGYQDIEPVAARKKQLKRLAADVLRVSFKNDGLPTLLAGKVEEKKDGRIRVTYEFDTAREVDDFTKVPGYLNERRADRFKVDKSEEDSSFVVKAGNLEMTGIACYRHTLAFEAPMTVEYELLYGRARAGRGVDANVLVGLCDDGAGSYAGAFDIFDLEMVYLPEGLVKTDYHEGERKIGAAKTYKLKLDHDGTKVKLKLKGKTLREIEAGPQTKGNVFLWIHSQIPVGLKKLTIEGKVSTPDEEKAREAWVEAQLLEAGFSG